MHTMVLGTVNGDGTRSACTTSGAVLEMVRGRLVSTLTARTDGTVVETMKARKLLHDIAEAAWRCADPGVQYDTTINQWHTLPNTGRINASNPCSEYMFLDDSACNLASLNLMKFSDADGRFDVEAFRKAVDITITAQEIIVGFASYPTKKIEINSFDYRPLGLGYANLGALLMSQGMAYDSDRGRDYAAAITAMMTGEAYLQSARIAGEVGPCAGFQINRDPFLNVMRMHRDAALQLVEQVAAGLKIGGDAAQGGGQARRLVVRRNDDGSCAIHELEEHLRAVGDFAEATRRCGGRRAAE